MQPDDAHETLLIMVASRCIQDLLPSEVYIPSPYMVNQEAARGVVPGPRPRAEWSPYSYRSQIRIGSD